MLIMGAVFKSTGIKKLLLFTLLFLLISTVTIIYNNLNKKQKSPTGCELFFVRRDKEGKQNSLFMAKVRDGKISVEKKLTAPFDKYQDNRFWFIDPAGNLCYLVGRESSKKIKLYLCKQNLVTGDKTYLHVLDYDKSSYFNNITISPGGKYLVFSDNTSHPVGLCLISNIYIINLQEEINSNSKYFYISPETEKRKTKSNPAPHSASHKKLKPSFSLGEIWNVIYSPDEGKVLLIGAMEPVSVFLYVSEIPKISMRNLSYLIIDENKQNKIEPTKSTYISENAVWSPDGSKLLYYSHQSNSDNTGVLVYDLKTMKSKKVFNCNSRRCFYSHSMGWSNKDEIILLDNDMVFISNTDGKYKVKSIKLPKDIRDTNNLQISPDGNFLMFFGEDKESDLLLVYDIERDSLMKHRLQSKYSYNEYFGNWIRSDGLSIAGEDIPSPPDIYDIKRIKHFY